MALQTPRQRGLQRPSFSPNDTTNSHLSASTAVNRKASLRALTAAQQDPRTPASSSKMDAAELEVGDAVNVPGDMYGVVKFVGNVRGKTGRFVGVELDREFATRGKNDGDVDGISYFHTAVPGAGIFLPVHRAERRGDLTPSAVSTSDSPNFPATPSHSTLYGQSVAAKHTPPTPALPHKFAQSVGPGVRPPSPNFKPKRPSLPRPESPFRKQPPNLAPTTPGRTLSQSQRGGPRPGQTPGKSTLKSSTIGRPGAGQTPRPYSRTASRMGRHNETLQEEDDTTPVGVAATTNGRTTSTSSVPSFSQPLRSPSRLGSAGGVDQEMQRLKSLLAERDKRLEEQAASLADMENSVKELSALISQDGVTPGGSTRKGSFAGDDDQTSAQLRQMLREKNEKISLLTAEFDAHRADFRSTLDSLEMASTETERVYEEQKRDLIAQLAELQEVSQSKEDFEGVAQQLKQLEELVAELEEGLEESRRGEAEARGEVEFLRGEVERGRSELRREREKAAVMVKGSEGPEGTGPAAKEMEKKDDEIRGLKAIIHGLSGSARPETLTAAVKGVSGSAGEVQRLQTALEDSQREEDALEKTIEQLRRDQVAVTTTNGSNGSATTHARNESERTATAPESGGRPRAGTIKAAAAHISEEEQPALPASNGKANGIYCEMCESADHDTLDCTSFQQQRNGTKEAAYNGGFHDYSPGKENEYAAANGNGAGKVVADEEDKWCALCEKDGHLAFDCPEEQY